MKPGWLDKLARRAGFLAIPDLSLFLAVMNGAVAILARLRPDFPSQLTLDPDLLRRGQLWRLVTFLFIPPEMSSLWLVFWLILFYLYARALEESWGEFQFTAFCALGAGATGLASLGLGQSLSNVVFNTSLFLAFARLNPEFELLLFFVLPLKMKWLAGAVWILTLANLLAGGAAQRWAVAAGLANYLIFFGPGHWRDLRSLLRRLLSRGLF